MKMGLEVNYSLRTRFQLHRDRDSLRVEDQVPREDSGSIFRSKNMCGD